MQKLITKLVALSLAIMLIFSANSSAISSLASEQLTGGGTQANKGIQMPVQASEDEEVQTAESEDLSSQEEISPEDESTTEESSEETEENTSQTENNEEAEDTAEGKLAEETEQADLVQAMVEEQVLGDGLPEGGIDLSFGSVIIKPNTTSGTLDVTYTATQDGIVTTTTTTISNTDTIEITQSNPTTATTNTITVKDDCGSVQITLNSINISASKDKDNENNSAINIGSGSETTIKVIEATENTLSGYNGIHSNSKLTIIGKGKILISSIYDGIGVYKDDSVLAINDSTIEVYVTGEDSCVIYANGGSVTINNADITAKSTMEFTGSEKSERNYGIYSSKKVEISESDVTVDSTVTMYGSDSSERNYGIYGENGININKGSISVTSNISSDSSEKITHGYGLYAGGEDICIENVSLTLSATSQSKYSYGLYANAGNVRLVNSSSDIYAQSAAIAAKQTIDIKWDSYDIYEAYKNDISYADNVDNLTISENSEKYKKTKPFVSLQVVETNYDVSYGDVTISPIDGSTDKLSITHTNNSATEKNAKISAQATIQITGNSTSYGIVVKENCGTVNILLNGINISKDNTEHALEIQKGNDVFLSTEGKNNTLKGRNGISSSSNLTLKGDGTLITYGLKGAEETPGTKNGSGNGISVCGATLTIESGVINAQGEDDGIDIYKEIENDTVVALRKDASSNTGKLIIKGGKLTSKGDDDGIDVCFAEAEILGGTVESTGAENGMYIADKGSLCIKGGKLAVSGSTHAINAMDGVSIEQSNPQVETIIEANASSPFGSSAIYSDEGNITINGGNINATADGIVSSAIYSEKGDIFINNGTITAKAVDNSYTFSYGGIVAQNGEIHINGGTVNATGDSFGIRAIKLLEISQKDKNIYTDITATSTHYSGVASDTDCINISGGKLHASSGNCGIYSGKNITAGQSEPYIKTTIIAEATYDNSSAIYAANGTIELTAGDIEATGKFAGVGTNAGNIIIKNTANLYAEGELKAIYTDNGIVDFAGLTTGIMEAVATGDNAIAAVAVNIQENLQLLGGTIDDKIIKFPSTYNYYFYTGDSKSLAEEVDSIPIIYKTVSEKNYQSTVNYVRMEPGITITYQCSEGGSINNTHETIPSMTGIPSGSTATADEGYKFTGWYDEKGNQVATDANFVPLKQSEGRFSSFLAATYIANFAKENIIISNEDAQVFATSGTNGTQTGQDMNTIYLSFAVVLLSIFIAITFYKRNRN